jgi:hypothetical protein
VIDYKDHAISAGSTVIGKLGTESKRHIGKYSFVNRNIQVWNQPLADALGTVSCKQSNFRKRVSKVINGVK